jgi:hypothetical protein
VFNWLPDIEWSASSWGPSRSSNRTRSP